MLGEALYGKFYRRFPSLAGKLAGMFLEVDVAELLTLLESDEALAPRVGRTSSSCVAG